MKNSILNRTRIISIFVVFVAVLLIGKLYIVQIVRGEAFSEKAMRQYARPGSNVYDRGSIFFENKDGELIGAASLKLGYTVTINPELILDPEEVYKNLEKYIDIDKDEFIAKASKTDDPYEEIAKRQPREIADQITSLDIEGVSLYKEKWRFYPGNTLGANVLGFVGWDADIYSGRIGLEKYYDDTLSRDNENLYVNFFAEIFSNISNIVKGDSTVGGDVVTTIEPTVQSYLEKEIEKTNDRWNSTISGGIIMNPITGEIFAMAVDPTFDPNDIRNATPETLNNPLVQNVYEMGSIIKPLTVAAGLDTGAITSDSTYDDKGFLIVDGAKIQNYDGRGRGVVPIQEILSQSLNTGVAHIMLKMGILDFSKYMKSFGIGEETGIDLPGEVRGLISNLDSPRDVEHVTASFGQGIAMTPIETVRALSVIASGGILPNPHLADKILFKGGLSRKLSYGEGKRVLSKEASEETTRMLVEVVDSALLDGTVKMDNYSIAAKTGTAQIAKIDGRGYYDDRYLHSFFGYFPAYNPRFIIFLYTVEPKGEQYASHTLTEPFINTAKFLINYYEIPPDR